MSQFAHAAVYNTDRFEVLFKPDRSHPSYENTHDRRFALCRNEDDAKIIAAALNKWCDDGNGWVKD